LNNNQKYYSNLLVDGSVGPKTVSTFNTLLNLKGRRTEDTIKVVLRILNGLQFARYMYICEQNENQETFFFGWVLNRIG
jgi:typhoid toxin secretion A